MATHHRFSRWQERTLQKLHAPRFQTYTKFTTALVITALMISIIPAGVLGGIGITAAATVVNESFSGQTEPLLDCGPNSPYGYPCNPGLQWQDKDVGQPAALLVRGLQDGDRVSIHNISGSVSWGEGTATCENGDPSNAGTPKLVGIVQFVNANGRVVHVPGNGVHNTNALYLKDLEGQGMIVPQGAVRMYGSFPDSRYNDNRGECSFTIHVTSAGGGSSSSSSMSSSSSVSSSSNGNADLGITKTADRTTATVGQNVNYTVTVHNNGPNAAQNVVAADNLPTGLSYVTSSATQGSYNGHVWNIGTLANGQTVTLSIVAMVTAAGQITNIATITSTNPDNNGSNNQGSATITGVSGGGSSSSSISSQPSTNADLSVSKTANTTVATVGQNVIFTVSVHNNGPADAQNVNVNDTLPSGLAFMTSSTTQGTYNGSIWTVGTLGNNQTATLTVVAQVTGIGTVTNTATANSNNPDNNGGNNTGSVTITLQPASSSSASSVSSQPSTNADLALFKTANRSVANVGDSIVYTVTVHNNGPADAQNVIVNDTLPAGLAFQSSLTTQGTYNNNTGVWTVGTVPNGQSAILNIVATVTGTGNITNTATGNSNNPDQNGGNNSASVTITGTGGGGSSSSVSSASSSISSQPSTNADLSMTKTVTTQMALVGQVIDYTLRVINNGPADAQNVTATDVLPAGLTFVNAIGTQGTYNNNTGVWNIGTLLNGRTAILTIYVQVSGTGQITNTATVNSNNPDNSTGNNTSSITITGVPVVSSSSSTSSSVSSVSSVSSSSQSSVSPTAGCIQILKEAFTPAGGLMSPVPPFTFKLDNGLTVVSDASGNARFDNVTPGLHTITETIPQGWNQFLVTPQGGQVFVTAGGICAGVAFKNQQIFVTSSSSSISSSLPSSSSSSSVPPLLGCINLQKQAYNPAGAPITPVPQFLFTLDNSQTALNDANGNAFFGNVTPGTHTITETLPNGWTQVQTPGTITVQSGMSCASAVFKNQQIAPPSSSSSSMSSTQSSSSSSSSMISSSSSSSSQTPIVGCISILKQTFDVNGNPLNPVAPFVFQIDNGPLVSNDSNGYARFDNVPVGMHTITEIPQQGWNQIMVTPQNGQLSVAGGNLCAGILFRNQQTTSGQNVSIVSNSNTSVNSTINAVSGNSTTINQNGNGDQNAGVQNGANTSINSTINAVSGNVTNVTQNGNSSNGQTVIDLNNANTGVNSTINGASGNQTAINQNDNGGTGAQNAGVANSAGTNVNSTINALSGNATNVTQNSPMQLTPLFAQTPQAQAQSPMIPAPNPTTNQNQQNQNLLSSILSMLNTLQQQLASLLGTH